jgi:hypothetical protein
MAWAGWGAGPAGAGSAGGPSRWFLAILLVGCAGCTVIMAVTRNWPGAGVAALVTGWFFARLFLGVGRAKRDPDDPPGR